MKLWYESLFEKYAQKYDLEISTQGTSGASDFSEKDRGNDRSKRVLDVGCGTGRHTLELTARGYRVTGVDLSESRLDRARERGLSVDFWREDARSLPLRLISTPSSCSPKGFSRA